MACCCLRQLGTAVSGNTADAADAVPAGLPAQAFTGALPAGEWLASLRRLALPPVAAAASLGALAQATALEELCLVHLEDAVALEGFEVFGRTKQSVASDGVASVVDELAVLEWAARRPGLRRLALGSRMFQQYTPAQATLLAATAACTSAANPGLRVEQDWRLYREIAARLAGRRLVEQALPGSEPPPPEQPPAGEGCDSEEYVSDSDLGWW